MPRASDAATYTLADASRVLGVSRQTLYAMIKRGDVATIRRGLRPAIKRTEVQRVLEAREKRTA